MKRTLVIFMLAITFSLSAQTQLTEAVDFSAKDIHGETLHLFEFLEDGKLVVIDFFSTTCGPCGEYAPQIQESYEDFGSNQGNVIFMGIAWGDDNASVQYFDSVYGITYPSVSGFEGGGNEIINMYDIISYPTVILIHPDGSILNQYIWEPTTENINSEILAAGGIPVGREEISKKMKKYLNFFPNPAKDFISLHYESSGKGINKLEIFDVNGKNVLSKKMSTFDNNPARVSLSHLREGSYFIRYLKDNRVINTEMLIISR